MIAGIVLAAGASSRFGSNKLLHSLPSGTPIAVVAARNLMHAVKRVLAVVRSGDNVLAQRLQGEGLGVAVCDTAAAGMGHSLVAPSFNGQRGRPVGFGELIALEGDVGAREVFARYANEVEIFECKDPGICRDIDTPADL